MKELGWEYDREIASTLQGVVKLSEGEVSPRKSLWLLEKPSEYGTRRLVYVRTVIIAILVIREEGVVLMND